MSEDVPLAWGLDESTLVVVSFGLIGMSSLFAWNAVITCSTYWTARFCGSAVLERSFESAFSAIYQCASLAATVVALRDAKQTDRSPGSRVVRCQAALAVLFAAFTVLALWPEAPRKWVFAPCTLVGVGVCGVLSQKMCSACYGIASALPQGKGGYFSSLMAGQAAGGLIPALIVVASEVASPSKTSDDKNAKDCRVEPGVTENAVAYFATSAALYVLSIGALRTLERTQIYHEALSSRDRDDDDDDDLFGARSADTAMSRLPDVAMTTTTIDNAPLLLLSASNAHRFSHTSFESGFASSSDMEEEEEEAAAPATTTKGGGGSLVVEVAALTRTVAYPAGAVVAVFAVTLSTFPAFTALARPRGHQDDDDTPALLGRVYVPLLFFTFNLGDFLGRAAAARLTGILPPRHLLGCALARVVFIPMVLLGTLAHTHNGIFGGHHVAILRTTAAPLVLALLIALTNGLFATLAMGAAAPLVEKHQRELCGNIMSLYLTVGLTLGSLFSFVLLAIVS